MLKNMTVGRKIFLGFISVLVLLSAVGFISYEALVGASQGFTSYREMARDANLGGQLQANMLMVRMQVKDFLITGSAEHIRQFDAYWNKMEQFQAQAQKEILDPERAAMIDSIETRLGEYKTSFGQVVERMNQRNAYVSDVLDQKGPFMEKTLSKIMVSAHNDDDASAAYYTGTALRGLLLGRLYMAKFLNSNDLKDVERVQQEFSGMQEALGILDRELDNPERREMLAAVAAAKNQYITAFDKLVQVIKERNGIIADSLDRIGPEVAQDIEDVKLSIKEVQDELGPKLVASNKKSLSLIVIVGAGAILGGLLLALVITRGITRPIQRVVDFAGKLRAGDLSAQLEEGKDEIGVMSSELNSVVEALRRKERIAAAIAKGDLNQDVSLASDKDSFGKALRTMVSSLNGIVGRLYVAADQVDTSSKQVSESSMSLSQGATEQASSLEEITSSMTEISAQTKTNADNAGEASNLAVEATGAAEKGVSRMAEMTNSMSTISESSQEIAKIIKVIDDIAFQTNLLALNAAVESARAGVHGKGFAVVAQEVRTLASRSAKAAQGVSDLIENAVNNIHEGAKIAENTSQALDEIQSSVSKAANLVADIAVSSNEQAKGIYQVNEGLSQIDSVTQQNAANAEETSAASMELSSQATALRGVLAFFQTGAAASGEAPRAAAPEVRPLGIASQSQKALPREPEAWGGDSLARSQVRPDQLISLDDSEFDRY
ncbi:methyl-accepting chemotaxis protein [Desulfatibacillum alkenivorans DSM 16219]|jgi:methyl-accepting chemotaxis protein|uniref:Methyl-accepting chemotaxis protein n=1 Tax=Desulfatibacillum alkenivorans DSM 16219 TaxID=1121393 RepID=A0A1M6I3V5_9BACT|nr:methyl-accepting chemotaxis protein [Desulfatibacillum alkenivorans]SHJ29129.1 methyl-accepting chemotaxis protein [Desulfatibacillum alkenivorans DSM 16219]